MSLHSKGKIVFYGILGANTAVFAAWYQSNNDRELRRFMYKHFTMSNDAVIRQRRYYTMISSTFSHKSFDHFLFNMIGLYTFGKPLVLQHLGPMRFLTLYGLGGVISSACQLMLHNKIPYNWPSYHDYSWYSRSLGASGAINAIVAYYILLSPSSTIFIYFIPVPALLAGLGLISLDAYGLYYGGTGIGHGAHLGGALVGAVYFLVTRRLPPITTTFRR